MAYKLTSTFWHHQRGLCRRQGQIVFQTLKHFSNGNGPPKRSNLFGGQNAFKQMLDQAEKKAGDVGDVHE